MNHARIAVGLACWAALGAVGPTPIRTPPAGDGEIPVEVEVIEITQLDHSTQLLVELHNGGDRTVHMLGLGDPAYQVGEERRFDDMSGIHLLDEAANVEYLPFRDPERTTCVCSRFPEPMEEGETWTGWWRSALLPDSVETVTVLGPNGEELATDVEVQG